MDLSWENWLTDFSNYGWWEVPAVIGALAYVLLAAKKNKWCFLYGLISSLIYVYLTLRLKLYFDSFINAYYVMMSVYGWIEWDKKDESEDLSVTALGWKKFLYLSTVALALALLLGWWAEQNTDASLPYWDSFTTVFALLATYWVVRKLIENWIVWIIVDLVSCIIYLYKGLPLTSILFLVYTIMAIFGYFNWKKKDHAN